MAGKRVSLLDVMDKPEAVRAIHLLKELNDRYSTHIGMEFTSAKAGHAKVKEQEFFLPIWTFKHGVKYVEYYVIHEFTHCLGLYGHDRLFKAKEQELLSLYNLICIYAKAYPAVLLHNGKAVYTKQRRY